MMPKPIGQTRISPLLLHTETAQGGGGGDAESRFWFVPSEVKLVRSDDGQSFLFDRVAVQLMTEDMWLGHGAEDPDTKAFAEWSTANFDRIAAEAYPYPSLPGYEYPFRRLEQVVRAVAFARFLYDNEIPIDFSWMENYDLPFVDTPKTTPTVVNSYTQSWSDPPFIRTLTISIIGGVDLETPNTYLSETGAVAAMSGIVLGDRPDELVQQWHTRADGEELTAVALSLNTGFVDGLDSRADTDLWYQTPGEVPLGLTRYYCSAEPTRGPFGFGWQFAPYEIDFTRPEFYSSSRSGGTFLNGLHEGEIRIVERATGRVLYATSPDLTEQLTRSMVAI